MAGSTATYFSLRGAQGGASPATVPVTIADGPPNHPLVGIWRVRIAPLVITYVFNNDREFLLTFKGIPGSRGTVLEHHAKGSWGVNGGTLRMLNTSSNSAHSVVGETEEAKILSFAPDLLVLEHSDRNGKPEQLQLERVRPFVKGKFDNPALIGEWRSDEYSLQLRDSGDANFASSFARSISSGHWSQERKQLRLMLTVQPATRAAERSPLSRRATAPPIPPQAEPFERVYEIFHINDQRNMLVLHPTGSRGDRPLTFYRIN